MLLESFEKYVAGNMLLERQIQPRGKMAVGLRFWLWVVNNDNILESIPGWWLQPNW